MGIGRGALDLRDQGHDRPLAHGQRPSIGPQRLRVAGEGELHLGVSRPLQRVLDERGDVLLESCSRALVLALIAVFVADVFVSDQLSITATYSVVDRNLFRNQDGIADIALNAPMNKATLSANYRNPRKGFAAELRGRYVDRFPMNSGVFVGVVDHYTVMDANVTYALPFARGTDLSIAASNVFDERHQEFVGAPEIGRLVVARVRYTLR